MFWIGFACGALAALLFVLFWLARLDLWR